MFNFISKPLSGLQYTVYSNIISNRNFQIKNKLTCLFAKLDINFVSNDSALTT